LPLTAEWYPHDTIEELEDAFQRIGKSLGRVRDAGARTALLAYFEARIPPAVPALHALRREQERDRLRLARKLIKRIERAELTGLLDTIVAGPRRARWPWKAAANGWRDELRRAIGERAEAARDAIDHATGVYFPNRSHAARLALKKLRYGLEIACSAGGDRAARRSLRYLKNAQDVLGDLHDRHMLVDDLPAKPTSELPEIDRDHITVIRQVVDAERRDLHARFLRRRPEVLQICRRFAPAHRSRSLPVAPAVAALMVSSAFYLWRRTRASEPEARDPDISIRIPIPDAPVLGR